MSKVNPLGGTGDPVRDGWCTPRWFAELIGPVDIDPCSNERSHIQARLRACGPGVPSYADGVPAAPACGLAMAPLVPADWLAFINCGYSRGTVIQFVRAYAHVRFQFLLRFDTSTEWFSELFEIANWIAFPRLRRVNFEPPPGVPESSNAYPIGLFCRDLPRKELRDACYIMRVDEGAGTIPRRRRFEPACRVTRNWPSSSPRRRRS